MEKKSLEYTVLTSAVAAQVMFSSSTVCLLARDTLTRKVLLAFIEVGWSNYENG